MKFLKKEKHEVPKKKRRKYSVKGKCGVDVKPKFIYNGIDSEHNSRKGWYFDVIQRAIVFATRAHEGQFRKGTTRPFIVHPLEVGKIVATMTDDEEIISAAILHDTIEDCEGVTQEEISKTFSTRVANLVAQESEDKSKTWMERKSATIERLGHVSREVQMIGLADKLSNMRDIDRDYPECGEELWNRFRMKDKNTIGWYYKGILTALKDSMDGVPAYEEYCELVKKHF